MPLNLAAVMISFRKNDKKTPGVFKVFLHHAEFEKNKSNWTIAKINEYHFLRK